MKTKIFSILTLAGLMVTGLSSAFANVNPGAACGCPALASRTTVNISSLTNAAGDFTAKNTILDCSKTYVLDNNNANTTGKYYVGKGKTITIQPGTVIKGMPETTPGTSRNGGILVISRGAKIINSGILTYISIRHGGEVIGANNEINGLTLGSVGRATTIHHIEVMSNLDDGIEFFGGTVDLKYASVLFSDDDSFDWDLNWSGRGQFWVSIKTDQATAAGGDNGFESDGDDNKVGSGIMSNPNVYNVTYLGSLNINGNATNKGFAIEMKEQTNGTIRNSIFANYRDGARFNNDTSRVNGIDAYDNWRAGTLKVECNTFVGMTNPLIWRTGRNGGTTMHDSIITLANQPAIFNKFFTTDGNVSVPTLGGFDFTHAMNVSTNVVSDVVDMIPTVNTATTCTAAPNDGFFTPAPYRGAFEAGKKSWLSNYSMNACLDLENGLVPCNTDANADGTTNVSDLNLLLIQFGIICD
ncbi:MAG: hypothetical protein IPL63_12395 [Saprospiraceae bacterium]|nr:hypothetical protein [Saprospiraceae bacterium]